jgi:hypothetical protein
LDSIGHTKSLNRSSVARSSATPRKVTIGAGVWQLIRPGIATWPRASMPSLASTSVGSVVTDSMTPSRTTIVAFSSNPILS